LQGNLDEIEDYVIIFGSENLPEEGKTNIMKRFMISVFSLLLITLTLSCNNDSGTGLPPLQPPSVNSISPSRVSRGDHVIATIGGDRFTGTTQVSLGNEINVENFSVLSPNSIEVHFTVNQNAATADHNVSVTSAGGTGTATNLLKVINNRAPVTRISVAPSEGATNTDFTFDGQGSTDSDGHVITYHWDFGDGKVKVGPVVSHSFSAVGNYEVTLDVIDNDEATGQATASVQVVKGTAPTAKFAFNPKQGDVLTTYTFDASQSFDPDGRISKYEWNFGDGNKAEGAKVQKNFTKGGLYSVRLVVTDNKGLQSSDYKDVSVGDFDPEKATQEIRGVTNEFFRRYSNLHGYSAEEIVINWSSSLGCPGRNHEIHIIEQQKDIIQSTSAIPTSPADVIFGSTSRAHAIAPAHFVWTNYDGSGGNAIATHDFEFVFESGNWQICNFTVY
jgi:chitodextrinase